jgi:hypothetical protein
MDIEDWCGLVVRTRACDIQDDLRRVAPFHLPPAGEMVDLQLLSRLCQVVLRLRALFRPLDHTHQRRAGTRSEADSYVAFEQIVAAG